MQSYGVIWHSGASLACKPCKAGAAGVALCDLGGPEKNRCQLTIWCDRFDTTFVLRGRCKKIVRLNEVYEILKYLIILFYDIF